MGVERFQSSSEPQARSRCSRGLAAVQRQHNAMVLNCHMLQCGCSIALLTQHYTLGSAAMPPLKAWELQNTTTAGACNKSKHLQAVWLQHLYLWCQAARCVHIETSCNGKLACGPDPQGTLSKQPGCAYYWLCPAASKHPHPASWSGMNRKWI